MFTHAMKGHAMKSRILLLLAVLSMCAHAQPTLTAAPYPTTATQPTAANLTVNGANPITCTLAAGSAGAVIPTCNLASITVPGTYTLVLNVSTQAGCLPPVANGATCTGGGAASSAPFSYRWNGSAVATPVLSVSP